MGKKTFTLHEFFFVRIGIVHFLHEIYMIVGLYILCFGNGFYLFTLLV